MEDKISITIAIIDVIASLGLAVVALFGGIIKRWWHQPKVRFSCNFNSYIPNSESFASEDGCSSDVVYMLKFENYGRAKAEHVCVECEAILKQQPNGKSYALEKQTLPLRFTWGEDARQSILQNDSLYLRFIRFQKDKKGDAESSVSQREDVQTCVLCANAIGRRMSDGKTLSYGKKPVTYLICLAYRAENLSKAERAWVFVHWEPVDDFSVTQQNFDYRLATCDERKMADNIVTKELKRGVE